jgi:hypothetical protein
MVKPIMENANHLPRHLIERADSLGITLPGVRLEGEPVKIKESFGDRRKLTQVQRERLKDAR